jgi:peptidyl-prolyl cis-trans isomerase D
MLQRLRDSLQAQRWVAYTVLGVLALVFVAWGAYGVVDLNIGVGNYAAKVEGDKVSVEEARDAWVQQQSQWESRMGGELPDALKRQLQDQLLESMVRTTLLTQRTRELGYRVSDTQVLEALRAEPAFQLDGKYSAEMAKSRLAQVGIPVAAFEADLRRNLQRTQLQNSIRISEFMTPRELGRLRALVDEQREVRYVQLVPDKFAGSAPIEDARVQAFYKENQARFMTPEWVRLSYGELRLDQLAAQIQVADSEVRDAYEKSKDSYVEPEKRRGRHVLIQVGEGKDDAAARRKADEVLAKANGGEDFAELAKKNSDDTGSAQNGGDLGWAERGYFVPEFADALFGMKPGEIRGPVKTQFGYHVIKLEEVQTGKVRTFEEVRGELESQLRRDRAANSFGDLQEQIQRRLEESGANASFEALVKDFGLQGGEVERFERGTGGGVLGNSPEIMDVAFSNAVIDEKRVGGPVALGEDRIVIVKALEHHKPEAKPLETVRPEIVAELTKQRGTEAARKAGEEATKKLESGTPFDQVAKDLGVTAEAARFVGRDDPSVPGEVRNLVFNGPKPTKSKPLVKSTPLGDGSVVVAQVTDVRSQAQATNAAEQAQWSRQHIAQNAAAEFDAYVEELRRTADVSKNPKAFE